MALAISLLCLPFSIYALWYSCKVHGMFLQHMREANRVIIEDSSLAREFWSRPH